MTALCERLLFTFRKKKERRKRSVAKTVKSWHSVYFRTWFTGTFIQSNVHTMFHFMLYRPFHFILDELSGGWLNEQSPIQNVYCFVRLSAHKQVFLFIRLLCSLFVWLFCMWVLIHLGFLFASLWTHFPCYEIGIHSFPLMWKKKYMPVTHIRTLTKKN